MNINEQQNTMKDILWRLIADMARGNGRVKNGTLSIWQSKSLIVYQSRMKVKKISGEIENKTISIGKIKISVSDFKEFIGNSELITNTLFNIGQSIMLYISYEIKDSKLIISIN